MHNHDSISTETRDFPVVNLPLTFQTNDPLCEDLATVDDTVLEDSETFQIIVSSSDPNVTLGSIPSASVTIMDNDSM